MELIKDLEQKFQNLDATLNSKAKVHAFYTNYNNSYNRINAKIFNESKEKKYKNGLNECRVEMLKQLDQKRDEQLQQLKEFLQSNQQNSLTELKSLHKTIKQKYVAFAKGLSSVFESIMFRSKLSNLLKLNEFVKYVDLMRIGEQVCLAKVEDLLGLESYYKLDVHVLPSNRIFLYCPFTRNMVVLNKSGDLIHLKELPKEFEYFVQVNATNIITNNRSKRIVEIYNFKLELVHSIKLGISFYHFKLNNYEIVVSNKTIADELIITCYNYKYKTAQSKKKEICINTDQLKKCFDFDTDNLNCSFEIVDLNDRFFFIKGACNSGSEENSPYSILVFNRDNHLFWHHKCPTAFVLVYNNQIACSNSYESDEGLFRIYDVDSALKRESTDNLYKINGIHSTSNYKHIYLKELDYRNFTLEFDVY